MKIILLITVSVFIFLQIAHGADLDLFGQRFLLKRNDEGILVAVIDKSLIGMAQNLKAREYIQGTMEELIEVSNELKSRRQKGSSPALLKDFLDRQISALSLEDNRQMALSLLASLDTKQLQELMNYPEWSKVYQTLDLEINGLAETYATLAHPSHRLYFYKNNVFNGIATGITSLIKSLLPYGAWLDLANFMVKRFIDSVQENQKFHKNILLYYVRNYSAEELGISEVEKDRILSSLMDDEIPLYALWDVWKAHRNWDGFGEINYAKSLKKVNKGISKYAKKFRSLDQQWGEFFYLATSKKGKRLVLNFIDPVYYFTRYPSVGMYLDKRWANILERSVYEVVKFAIRFLPWGFVGTIVDPLLNIRYKDQIEHEGGMLAHLEGADQEFNLAKDIVRQSINPFIITTGRLQASTDNFKLPNLIGDFSVVLNR